MFDDQEMMKVFDSLNTQERPDIEKSLMETELILDYYEKVHDAVIDLAKKLKAMEAGEDALALAATIHSGVCPKRMLLRATVDALRVAAAMQE